VTNWSSTKARQVLKALKSIGWQEKPSHKKKGGSHRQLVRPGFPDFTWAFHDKGRNRPGHAEEDCQTHRSETRRFVTTVCAIHLENGLTSHFLCALRDDARFFRRDLRARCGECLSRPLRSLR